MTWVRCSKCRGRSRLSRRDPTEYVRLPRCRHCGVSMTAHPQRPTDPHYYVDRYRMKHERGNRGAPLCRPGRGGCDAYHFTHRRGSGWCTHNHRKTDAERAAYEGYEEIA